MKLTNKLFLTLPKHFCCCLNVPQYIYPLFLWFSSLVLDMVQLWQNAFVFSHDYVFNGTFPGLRQNSFELTSASLIALSLTRMPVSNWIYLATKMFICLIFRSAWFLFLKDVFLYVWKVFLAKNTIFGRRAIDL